MRPLPSFMSSMAGCRTQKPALDVAASWVGASTDTAPAALDAALILTPVGSLVPTALRAMRKSGTVVCGSTHMSDIPTFPIGCYGEERRIVSVANLTPDDGHDLTGSPPAPLGTHTRAYPLRPAL